MEENGKLSPEASDSKPSPSSVPQKTLQGLRETSGGIEAAAQIICDRLFLLVSVEPLSRHFSPHVPDISYTARP
jgi:hypothetical protein